MIDFKNPAQLREWLKGRPGAVILGLPPKMTETITLGFEALPYWIERAEKVERAVERLLNALDHGARCPQEGMWDDCHDYSDDAKCRACRKEWAMKEGK